jgi:hypothetical protein
VVQGQYPIINITSIGSLNNFFAQLIKGEVDKAQYFTPESLSAQKPAS